MPPPGIICGGMGGRGKLKSTAKTELMPPSIVLSALFNTASTTNVFAVAKPIPVPETAAAATPATAPLTRWVAIFAAPPEASVVSISTNAPILVSATAAAPVPKAICAAMVDTSLVTPPSNSKLIPTFSNMPNFPFF